MGNKNSSYKRQIAQDKKKKDRTKRIKGIEFEQANVKFKKRKSLKDTEKRKVAYKHKTTAEMAKFKTEMEAFRTRGIEENLASLNEILETLPEDSLRRNTYIEIKASLEKLIDPHYIADQEIDGQFIDGDGNIVVPLIEFCASDLEKRGKSQKEKIDIPVSVLLQEIKGTEINYVNYPKFLAKFFSVLYNLFVNETNFYLYQKLLILALTRDLRILKALDLVEGTNFYNIQYELGVEKAKAKLDKEEVDKVLEEMQKDEINLKQLPADENAFTRIEEEPTEAKLLLQKTKESNEGLKEIKRDEPVIKDETANTAYKELE